MSADRYKSAAMASDREMHVMAVPGTIRLKLYRYIGGDETEISFPLNVEKAQKRNNELMGRQA
jgi:hypothetical protein